MQLSFLLKTLSQKQNIYRWLWYWTVFFSTVESCIINRTTFIFMCPTGNERRASLGCRLLWATLLNWKVTKSKNLRATGGWQPSSIFLLKTVEKLYSVINEMYKSPWENKLLKINDKLNVIIWLHVCFFYFSVYNASNLSWNVPLKTLTV